MILYDGVVIHSSGEELYVGEVYHCSDLPNDGEWLIMVQSVLFFYQKEGLDISSINFLADSDPVDEEDNTPKSKIFKSLQDKLANNLCQFRDKWRKTLKIYPFYRQHSSNDCAVACLMMVAKYWGKKLDYRLLVNAARVDRNGASLLGLIDAGESVGFLVNAGKTDLRGLECHDLPVIAHWEGNHFVVVYEVNATQVIINDPRIGTKYLSRPEFCSGWSGYALWLSPTVDFQRIKDKKISFSQFFSLLQPYKKVLSEIIAASIGVQILGLISPIITQILLDQVVTQSSSTTFWAIGIGLLIVRIIRELTISIRRYLLFHTGNKLDLTLIVNFIAHALKLSVDYYDSRYVGDLVSRIGENRKIRQFITGDVITTALDIVSVFLYASVMFWYSWKLSIIALLIVPFLLIVTSISTPVLVRKSREVFASFSKEQSYLIEILTGITTIKSMGVERAVRWRWENLINQFININFDTQMVKERLRVLSIVGETLISTSVLLVGVWLVMHQELSVGQLIAFNMLLVQVIDPLKRLNFLWHEFQEIRIAIERTEDVLNAPIEQQLSGKALRSLNSINKIEFQQVSFKYDKESQDNTISNLSFSISAGQTVAIVGKSGSGKTTIGKLLLGLYLPHQGNILIDGIELNHFKLRSLRRQIGVVNQDTFLFGGTIKENLSVTFPEISLQEIKQACEIAGAAEFIEALPLGYDTKIGEGGGLLSGGQRQRIAIARALLGSPSLLILDEATSSLDTESERIIQNNLGSILAMQTTLIIAHRLSTVTNADLILVLDRGSLIESGTHQELMSRRGHYHNLVSQQLQINLK